MADGERALCFVCLASMFHLEDGFAQNCTNEALVYPLAIYPRRQVPGLVGAMGAEVQKLAANAPAIVGIAVGALVFPQKTGCSRCE